MVKVKKNYESEITIFANINCCNNKRKKLHDSFYKPDH
jgi:hypothetical protein